MQYFFFAEGDGTFERNSDRVDRAVAEFVASLAPNVPRPEVVLLTDAKWTDQEWRKYRRKHRFHRRRGVYLHFSAAGELLYVGKGASEKQRLDRCWANDPEDRQWTLAVTLDDGWTYFGPALEQFLIHRLRPRDNCITC